VIHKFIWEEIGQMSIGRTLQEAGLLYFFPVARFRRVIVSPFPTQAGKTPIRLLACSFRPA
jgi:hypothetical protein